MNKHDEARERIRRLFNNHSLKFEDGDNVPKIKHYYEENEKYINECEAIEKELKRLQKKEIPMKVIIHDDLSAFECINCINHGVTDSMWLFTNVGEYDYCPRCGQRLDWSGEEIK
jgi:ribosome-binding ATPase YchF (GTP1/OBG family)